jgi:hypothetical protein
MKIEGKKRYDGQWPPLHSLRSLIQPMRIREFLLAKNIINKNEKLG